MTDPADFADNPIDELCERANRLTRYALDFAAQPAPVTERSIRRQLDKLLRIERDVLRPFLGERGIHVSVLGGGGDKLRQLQLDLAQGNSPFSDVADALHSALDAYAKHLCSVVSDRLRALDDDALKQLALRMYPFHDDYHVSA